MFDKLSEFNFLTTYNLQSDGIKKGMLSLGGESSSLYFPLDQQSRLSDRAMQSDDNKRFLLSGVKQATIFSQSGCYIQTDPIVTWFNKEKVRVTTHFSCLIHHHVS